MDQHLLREIIVQLLGFALFFWILKLFAWKPILKLIDDRKEKIRKEFQGIEDSKKAVEDLRKDYEARLTQIEEEARKKIQEAIHEGRRVSQELRDRARLEASQILEKAKENIELEMDKAEVELRQRIVNLSLACAEQLLNERLNEEKNRELILDFINELSGGRKG